MMLASIGLELVFAFASPAWPSSQIRRTCARRQMAPANQTWLVVGASRGIGREFGKQLLERGDALLATVRKKTSQHEISYWTGDPVQSSLCSVFEADMLNEQTIDVGR